MYDFYLYQANIELSTKEEIEIFIEELISNINNKNSILLKLSLSFKFKDNIEFFEIKNIVSEIIDSKFGTNTPLITFIPQSLLNFSIAAESILLHNDFSNSNLIYKSYNDTKYLKIQFNGRTDLIIANIQENKKMNSLLNQSEYCFNVIKEIFAIENFVFSDIIRQWNYIENIYNFELGSDFQNYQIFNDVRSIFYEDSNWNNGYPAATGIGISNSGLIMDLIATKVNDNQRIIPIKNPNQVDAHSYENSVLKGKNLNILKSITTPKFERAKYIESDLSSLLFISGTAAIIGQDSIANSIETQTEITINNILILISEENLIANNIRLNFNDNQLYFKIYIKNKDDYHIVENICSQMLPKSEKLYVIADICREELLIEIEGIIF